MKKIAILFLLLTTAVAFTFGQVALKGTFEVKDIGQYNSVQDPTLYLDATGSAATEIGPGSLSLDFQLEYVTSFEEMSTSSAHSYGDSYLKVGYGLPLGPGTLGANVELGAPGNLGVYLKPQVQYTGIAAGPLAIGVGAYYKYQFDGRHDLNMAFGNPNTVERKAFHRSGQNGDLLGGWFDLAMDFGLYFKYEFIFDIDLKEANKLAYIDIAYTMDPLKVGVELDDTRKDFRDFTVKPYVNITVSDAVAFGFYVKFQNLLSSEDTYGSFHGPEQGDTLSAQFTPGVWVKYTI